MVILKYISAYDQLSTFAQDKWDEVGILVKYILDNNLKDSFDNYVTMEFPRGCDESEFEEFCCKEAKYIIKEI